MKKFYFVGGPKAAKSEEFFRRLDEVGGTPAGWRIYPHAFNDGKALHIVDVASQDEILHHLGHFHDIYEWSDILEILETP
jgi:hypothetical protein